MPSDATRFFVELPADKDGNTAFPAAVIEARVEPDPRTGQELLFPVAPGHHAKAMAGGWFVDAYGGWVECEGPARMLTHEEWAALIASLAQPKD